MAVVKGCLLVGSVPLPDSETVFRDAIAGMPNRLKRIPDGETGSRHYFTLFQAAVFSVYPSMMVKFTDNKIIGDEEFTPEQIDEGIKKLQETDLKTDYDTSAIESYKVFKRLKDEGLIPKDVKFQVGIPTGASVIGPFVQKAFQSRAYPIYEEALKRALVNIQAAIPHEELSVQLDLAGDTALWEGVYMQPWFTEDPKTYTVDYITRMISWIEQDVELGLHNCYGDMDHKHWHEPTSLKAVSERGLAILKKSNHKISYFHAPVPVSAMSFLDDYMEPIKEFYQEYKAQGGELYLGVIQHNDLEGTKKRIEAVGKIIPEFGIATECGMGRTPEDQIKDLFKLSTELSQPVN